MCGFVTRTLRAAYLLAVLLGALAAGCTLNAPTETPAPTRDAPQVRFLNLENDTVVVEGTDVTLDLLIEDRLGVVRVELRVDGMFISDAGTPDGQPVTQFRVLMNWLAQGVGRHFLSITAYRADGTPGDDANLVLQVIAGVTATP